MTKVEVVRRFHDLFEAQLSQLQVAVEGMRGGDVAIPPDDQMDPLDYANALVAKEMQMEIESRAARLMAKVRAALRRIQDGTFGICQECECEISPRRLEARPTSTLCVPCKTALEARGGAGMAARQGFLVLRPA